MESEQRFRILSRASDLRVPWRSKRVNAPASATVMFISKLSARGYTPLPPFWDTERGIWTKQCRHLEVRWSSYSAQNSSCHQTCSSWRCCGCSLKQWTASDKSLQWRSPDPVLLTYVPLMWLAILRHHLRDSLSCLFLAVKCKYEIPFCRKHVSVE